MLDAKNIPFYSCGMTTTLSTKKTARELREGDTIIHLDGLPAKIHYAGTHRDDYGIAYDFSFGPERIPFASRGGDTFVVLRDIPKVGDLATLCYPSDRYPFIVTQVTKTGGKIEISPLAHRIVSGSFQTNDAVVEYSKVPDTAGVRVAYWSSKRGCYTCHGTPVSIGSARFYQAPEV